MFPKQACFNRFTENRNVKSRERTGAGEPSVVQPGNCTHPSSPAQGSWAELRGLGLGSWPVGYYGWDTDKRRTREPLLRKPGRLGRRRAGPCPCPQRLNVRVACQELGVRGRNPARETAA